MVLQYRGLIKPLELTDGRRTPENPLDHYAVRVKADTSYGDKEIRNGRISLTLEEIDALMVELTKARQEMLEFNVEELEALSGEA